MIDYNQFTTEEFNVILKKQLGEHYGLDPWGCETKPGWNNLIMRLSITIKKYMEQNHKDQEWSVTQIKEKFGGLRYYTHGLNELCHGMIWLAESLSFTTCELCGEQGVLDTDYGWVLTLCPRHKKERDLEQEAKVTKFGISSAAKISGEDDIPGSSPLPPSHLDEVKR